MHLNRFVARQLGQPSALVGRFFLAPLWNRRNAALNEQALSSLALRPSDHVLEIGFGGGYLLGRMAAALPQGRLAGVDISPAMVEFCQKRYRTLIQSGKLAIECAPAEALPYLPASFDKVCTVNSLFYWQDVRQALTECRRVLKQGGSLVLCFTCKESLQTRRFAQQGLHLYEADEVKEIMVACGFPDVAATHAADQHRNFVCLIGK